MSNCRADKVSGAASKHPNFLIVLPMIVKPKKWLNKSIKFWDIFPENHQECSCYWLMWVNDEKQKVIVLCVYIPTVILSTLQFMSYTQLNQLLSQIRQSSQRKLLAEVVGRHKDIYLNIWPVLLDINVLYGQLDDKMIYIPPYSTLVDVTIIDTTDSKASGDYRSSYVIRRTKDGYKLL